MPLSNWEPPLAIVLLDNFSTDTTRLARIATILDEFADRFQIVRLTCHSEHYHGLPNAKSFDMYPLVERRHYEQTKLSS